MVCITDSTFWSPTGMELFGPEQTFSKEVDDKANAYFQAIYNQRMSVDRLLDLLKQFKDSSVKKDRVCVFLCCLMLAHCQLCMSFFSLTHAL